MYEDRLVRTGVLRPTPPRRRRRRPGIPLVLAAFGLAALGFAAFVDPAPRLVWNASASAPIGLYWADHVVPARGDFVLAELPPRAQRLAAERSYLPKGVPLVKRVAALARPIHEHDWAGDAEGAGADCRGVFFTAGGVWTCCTGWRVEVSG